MRTPPGTFEDRAVRLETTFGGAGVLTGDLTPECAAVVGAVLDALSAPAGAEDDRTREQRYHDALQEAMRSVKKCIVMLLTRWRWRHEPSEVRPADKTLGRGELRPTRYVDAEMRSSGPVVSILTYMKATWKIDGPLDAITDLQAELTEDWASALTVEGPYERLPQFLDNQSFRSSPVVELIIAYSSGVASAATIELGRKLAELATKHRGVKVSGPGSSEGEVKRRDRDEKADS